MRRLAVILALWSATCADGREIVGPWDPEYAAICVDSTVVAPDRVCRGDGSIGITIPNPLYREPGDST